MKLVLSKDISLPLDVVTQTIAILAKRRAGKSYTMRRLVEQLFKASQQVVIVDPKGDQWGIRSSADGKKPGFPVLILGGEHGDLPLEVSAGETIAKLVVQDRVSVLLDISLFRKHEVATFMTAFLENLYRLKAQEAYRTPLMLVIDEADAIAPQKPQKGEERMLGAAEDIVRRGGQRGIGCTLVTQRSAVLNKNVLTQAEMLVVLRTIAPQDLAAMKAWIDVHGTIEEGKELIDSLPALPIGDAYFWSPGWPTAAGIFTRTHVLPIETFDSGATPKPGERKIVPKNLADVDLGALKEAMAATIEQAKANDPKALKAEIVRLKREIEQKNVEKPSKQGEIVPMGVSQWRELGKKFGYWDYFEKQIKQAAGLEWEKVVREWERFSVKIHVALREAANMANGLKVPDKVPPMWLTPSNLEALPKPVPSASKKVVLSFEGEEHELHRIEGEPVIKEGARKMLNVLVQRQPMKVTRSQLALLANMSPKSSTFATYLSVLKVNGLLDQNGDQLTASEKGIAFLGENVRAPQGRDELRAMWRENLKAGARTILDVVLGYEGQVIGREQLAAEANMSPTSSTFATYLSTLRTNGLIEVKDGAVRASDLLL